MKKFYSIINNPTEGTDGPTSLQEFLLGLGEDKKIENWDYIGNDGPHEDLLQINLHKLNVRIVNKQTTCICTHNICTNYYIKNDEQKEIRIIGSSCVKRIFNDKLKGKCKTCDNDITIKSKHDTCRDCRKDTCKCGNRFNKTNDHLVCVECRKNKCKDCGKVIYSKISNVCRDCKKHYSRYDKDLIIRKNNIIYLKIQFKHKNIAKENGAKFDKRKKQWYVKDKITESFIYNVINGKDKAKAKENENENVSRWFSVHQNNKVCKILDEEDTDDD